MTNVQMTDNLALSVVFLIVKKCRKSSTKTANFMLLMSLRTKRVQTIGGPFQSSETCRRRENNLAIMDLISLIARMIERRKAAELIGLVETNPAVA